MVAPNIEFIDDRLRVRFTDYSAGAAYDLFKRVKALPEYEIELDDDGLAAGVTAPARFAPMLGLQVPPRRNDQLPWPAHMQDPDFDDQPAIVQLALDGKRYACWSDCGLGKTPIGLEYARQVVHMTGGRVLIVTLNEIVDQWLEESVKFYGRDLWLVRIDSRAQMKEWCATGCIDGVKTIGNIAITNYEKFNHEGEADQVVSELRSLAGFVLDESSRLKAGGGSQKWAIIKSARGIEFKLSLTATPAPNELMEFASQASFLERMRSESVADAAQQIIWTYFTRDSKTHRWTIKQHARKAFFEWMASWSIYVRDPRKYGWRKNWTPPPEPEYFIHQLGMTAEQRGFVMDFNAKLPPPKGDRSGTASLFVSELNAITSTKFSQAAKGFVYEKGETDGTSSQVPEDPDAGPTDAGDFADGCISSDGDGRGGVSGGGDTSPGDLSLVDGESLEGIGGAEGVTEGGSEDSELDFKSRSQAAKRAARRVVRPVDSLKPPFVADLIAREAAAGHQVIVWAVFDEEIAIIAQQLLKHPKFKGKALRELDLLTGKTSADDRTAILKDFRDGKCRVLITRASILGYGMNFQFVRSMVFSGFSFSYESFYQAVRRAYRHGQTHTVRVHLPIVPELEGQMWDAICRREHQHEDSIAEMEANYVNARLGLEGAAA